MVLSVCSAAPSCSSHLQISFPAGSRALCHLRKAVEDGHIIENRSFCLQDVIHPKDISFKTHATRFMHSLALEKPDQSGSADSSIFSPYPNDFDDIVRGFSNESTDRQAENLSCSIGNINSFHPVSGDLKYMDNSDLTAGKLLNGELSSDLTSGGISESISAFQLISSDLDLQSNVSPNGAENQTIADSIDQSLSALSGSASSSSSTVTTTAISIVPESPMTVKGTLDLTYEGPMDVKESVDSFLSRVTESLDISIDRAQGAVKSSYATLVSSFGDAVKTVTDSFDNVVSGLVSSAGNSGEQTTKELTGFSTELKENLYKLGTLAVDILRHAILSAEDSVSNGATFVVYSYGRAKSLLPLDFRNALDVSEEKTAQILSPVGSAFQQVYFTVEGFEKNLGLDPSDPLVPCLLLLGSSATIGISYWFITYGGYSGDLTPEVTLELLKNEENAVLIDVRPEDRRERDGVPDLRRSARSKYASVILAELDGSLRKLLKGGKSVDDTLLAVVIRNLKLVKDKSKVIVMDDSGSRSKSIARSLKKLGVKNAYVVHGGYQSWVRNGLRIKELKPETVLTVLNEEAEAILEVIKPTPTLIIGYGLGVLAAGYALLEWEKTLQVIGIIGLGQTLYRRFASYQDANDFKQDVRLLLSPVRVGAQAVSWAAGKLEPNKIGLPTSPSTTSVQDRVLQAAAKHESQPSDADDSQGLPTESSNENLDLSEA